ncbi:ArsR/SmtB family transcription factor [Enterococcus casseliflavus]|uniref:ArsR/SmtB family transcription factor n=1 Tax=Enterococcus casseliflavus TaxID=37734 RepID=UPI00289124EF|nr:metalloregulator ArsR/SmtB family transcription factor [Enterococcus casseliflavus]MDT2990825.1 metalloregulator ArsR/SmtB family transcription factor [Enterococcus casseliflavus]MDV7690580.1 metalloregulator ArsR/SmtB family transcription factor [Enterococcus casseliflavus]
MRSDICEITCIHEDKVNRAKEKLTDTDISTLSSILKLLGDENRLKIIYALSYEEELCVCDIANIIGATVATTSHHLLSLKKNDIVKNRKTGKLVYYSIKNNKITQLLDVNLYRKDKVLI